MVAVRPSEASEVDRGEEGAKGSSHLLARIIGRQRVVSQLGTKHDGNGALGVLGEERLRVGLAVDEAEVRAISGVLTTG